MQRALKELQVPATRSAWTVPAAAVCLALLTGCGSGPRSSSAMHAPAAATAGISPHPIGGTPVVQPSHGSRHGGGSGDARTAAAKLPADFPANVPIPPGSLQGSSGAGGQWGILLLATGSARRVLSSTMAFYVAAGYTADSAGQLHRGPLQITVVAESRDHSNTETNLALGFRRS